jgi:ribosome-binding factor A
MRPYRKEKIASVVQSVVGDAILHRLNDPRVEPLTTVTRVEVTGDLLFAKVYLSVLGDEAAERRTLQALRHAAGFIQKMLARQLSIRQCPELRFEVDRGIKEARRTLALLEENRRLEPELCAPEGEEKAPPEEEAEYNAEGEVDPTGSV